MTSVPGALVLWGPVFSDIDRSRNAEQFRQIRDEFCRGVLDSPKMK